MSETTATETKKRDGSVQRAEWQRMVEYHERMVKQYREKLARAPGAVSTQRTLATSKRWLEGMTVPQLHAQAQRVGIEGPEHYDDLDELITAVLRAMGLLEDA
jgi:hypothetical protein